MAHPRTFSMARLPVVLFFILSACAQNPPFMSPEEAEQAILAAERRSLDRWSDGDPVGYGDLAAEDVTFFDDIGATRRIDGREAFRTYVSSLEGRISPHRYEMVDPKVQVYGEVGILTLRYHASAPDGTPATPWKATSVYRWNGDEWRMVHAHWSKVDDPPS